MQHITVQDYILLPVYLSAFYFILKKRSIKFLGADLRKFFMVAFLLRMVGAIAYSLLVQYYYGYGDSFTYYDGSNFYFNELVKDPGSFKYFFTSASETQNWLKSVSGDKYLFGYIGADANLMVMRISTVFAFLSFNKFLIIALFFGLFSFAGQWKLFLVFDDILKGKNRKILAFLILYTPSIWFWGSGILKDSICIGATGFIIHILYNFFEKKQFSIGNLLQLLFMFYILTVIKSYISIILMVCLGALMVFVFVGALKNILLRMAMFLLFASVFLIVFISFDFTEQITKIAEETVQQVNSFKQNYETLQLDEENSVAGFEMADLDPSAASIILRSPKLIFTTLFRPFIWESQKLIMLFSAIESLFLLLCTLYLLVKTNVIGFFIIIFRNRFVFFCLLMSLSFALIIGLTTFNFGTMARYKIILLPFYYFMLVQIYTIYKQENKILYPA